MNIDYPSCRAGNRKIFRCVIPQLNPHQFVGGKACTLFFPPSLQRAFPFFPTNPTGSPPTSVPAEPTASHRESTTGSTPTSTLARRESTDSWADRMLFSNHLAVRYFSTFHSAFYTLQSAFRCGGAAE